MSFSGSPRAQARLGDYDGEYKTAGEPHPVNNVQTVRTTRARMNVMKAVAEAPVGEAKRGRTPGIPYSPRWR